MSIPGVSEGDIARFLISTPGFFERHAEALAAVRLTSPHGMRAVSAAGAADGDAARQDQGSNTRSSR
jgi:uncharacterized protein YigA (DUF484 family)